jgi:hypothetical protein
LLKFSALGLGVWWGMTRNYTLHSYVKSREEINKEKRYRELVEEGKIAFDTHEMSQLAIEAKKAHSKILHRELFISPLSFRYSRQH